MSKDLVKEIAKQVVHTDSVFAVDKEFEDPRYMKVRVSVMHSGINRNKSSFSTEVIKAAKNTFANIPILADVQEYTDENGNHYLDYSGHSMHVEEDYFTGDNRMIYDEKIVGIVPESNNFEIIHDEETGHDYATVDAFIFREYGNYACDILESRGGITDVSAEIACDDCSFSAEDKCLVVGKMTMCAITLLGAEVVPGMEKAHAEVFSLHNNSQDKLIQIMQELKESLDNYTNLTKGGTSEVNEENMNLETENVEETVVLENESVEEENIEITEGTTVEEDFADEDADVTPEEFEDEASEESEEETDNSDEDSEEVEEIDEVEEIIENHELKYSVDNGESVQEFAVSLSDIQYALSELVNTTYGDESSYYGVEVYMDESYVIMIDYWTGSAYKQTYKKKKECYQLTGDRVPVKAVYLTADEEKELEKMRSNYSSIESQLNEYQVKEEIQNKKSLMSSDEYASIANNEEFVELKKNVDEESDNLTFAELKEKADAIQLAAAKSGNLQFAAPHNDEKEIGKVTLPIKNKSVSRYGTIFSQKN